MAASDYQILVAHTRTGEVVDALDGVRWSFQEHLAWAEHGSLDVTVPLPGRDRAGQIVRGSLRSLAASMSALSLAVVRDRVALFAGPVTTLGWDDAQVSVGCASLSWLLDRRIVLTNGYWGDPMNPAANLFYDLVPRDLVLELLMHAVTGTGRNLPLTVSTQSDANGNQVTYRGSDLRTAHETIKAIVEADGGPDIVLQPQVSNDLSVVSWTASVGDPQLGEVNPAAVWDFPLVAVSGDLDDSETVSTAYVIGDTVEGGGDEQRTRAVGVSVRDRGDPWPVIERADRTSVSETDPIRLDALAESYGAGYLEAVEEVTLVAPTDAGPRYRDNYNLGDTALFVVTGHPWLDDGDALRRIVSVAVSADETTVTTSGPRLSPEAVGG